MSYRARSLNLELTRTMYEELLLASATCQTTPEQFAKECVEIVLAERRLPHVEISEVVDVQ